MAKFSLNKLNKIYKQLRTVKNSSIYSTISLRLDRVDIDSPSDIERLTEKALEGLKNAQQELKDYESILSDVYMLKEAIFAANVKSKVASLLNEKERLNLLKGVYDSQKGQLESNRVVEVSDITETLIRKVQSSDSRYGCEITVACGSCNEFSEKYEAVKKRLFEIEDELLKANAVTSINIELSEASKKFLGIV